jgi:hypothetical protein
MENVESKQRELAECEAVNGNWSTLYYIRKECKNLHFHNLFICVCRENLQNQLFYNSDP